jgi:hypothetical protein
MVDTQHFASFSIASRGHTTNPGYSVIVCLMSSRDSTQSPTTADIF